MFIVHIICHTVGAEWWHSCDLHELYSCSYATQAFHFNKTGLIIMTHELPSAFFSTILNQTWQPNAFYVAYSTSRNQGTRVSWGISFKAKLQEVASAPMMTNFFLFIFFFFADGCLIYDMWEPFKNIPPENRTNISRKDRRYNTLSPSPETGCWGK